MAGTIESDIRFRGLVQYLSTSAFFQLGKMANPVTGEIERNLEGAKFFIDMLDSLELKTRGALSEEEMKELEGALTSLRLNYIDEVKKDQEAPATEETAAEETPETADTEDKHEDQAAGD
ncbi:MAG: DUF1844 domain-containing protein [bacterium]|nr:DUF1844 domain-containing protein [bacterium]